MCIRALPALINVRALFGAPRHHTACHTTQPLPRGLHQADGPRNSAQKYVFSDGPTTNRQPTTNDQRRLFFLLPSPTRMLSIFSRLFLPGETHSKIIALNQRACLDARS